MNVVSLGNSYILKYHKVLIKSHPVVLYVICSKCGNDNDRIFKEGESIEILIILRLIDNVNK